MEIKPFKTVKKDWGYEIWLDNREYCGKILLVDKDACSSYHAHVKKTESFICLDGKGVLTINGNIYSLSPLEKTFVIKPGEYHKFEGITKLALLEISKHHEDTDVERMVKSVIGHDAWKLPIKIKVS